ncbi:MAG: endonuclease V [Deltaproteobacteria bacterium]|nr:endonuclease V [Deltaproteobacteria bacterium]
MLISDLHPWGVTYKEAVKIQKDLKDKVSLKKIDKRIKYVAGLDVSYAKGSNFPSLNKAEERWSQKKVSFPYIPGLLSFREIPALIDALRKMEIEPDLIFCDGQGILNKSTIGCAKSPLVGTYSQVGESKGNYAYLIHQNRIIGAVVRTRSKVKPIFVSPGYGVMLNDCVTFVLETCSKYRIPEPTRQAHLLVNSVRSRKLSGPI